MSPTAIGLIGICALLILIYARMWVGFVMFFVGFWGLVAILGWHQGLALLSIVPFRAVAEYNFAAMPLFLLMGMVVYKAGFAMDLFNSAYKWIGQLRGGLAMATAVACAFLGVITDSMVAVLTLGKVAVPEMRKYKYDDSIANASVVAGASLASLVPPSIAFILYGVLVGQSIGKLYIAAVIPSIVLTLMIMLLISALCRVKPQLAPAGPKTSFKEKIVSLKYTWSIVLILSLILGGIYAGIFTPTEAGAIGAAGSIIIGLANQRLNRQACLSSIYETAQLTAMVVLLMSGAFVFSHMMTVSKLPFFLSEMIAGLQLSKYLVLTVVIFIYIILGMFCDIVAAILITTPILYPVIISIGFDPIWYGVLMVLLIEIGLITPPIGMNVYVLAGITGTPIGTIFRGIWPFVTTIFLFIIFLIIFPQIALFLPNTM